MKRVSRRTVLKAAAISALAGCATPARQSNRIAEENAKPGTTDWLLTKTENDPKAPCRSPAIEGYCSHTSIGVGETLKIMVSANPASEFTLDIYRLGYYGGRGGRHVLTVGPLKAQPQPDPPIAADRVRACSWQASASIKIPRDWTSGVYLGKLRSLARGVQSYVIFIVRDERRCDFLFQCSDTTWAAYNRWPQFYSLYDNETTGLSGWYVGPGVGVSWDRPYGKYRQIFDARLSQGSGEFLLWEFPLAFWMEQQSYDVSYISNRDTHANPDTLLRTKAFLSIGHDEYWSQEMFDNVRAAIGSGVNAAFLCGNSVDGLIEFHDQNARSFSRIGKFGPLDEDIKNFGTKWKRHAPNPATLMGARTTFPYNGTGDWTCRNEKHWLFAHTGMKNGDSIPGLVGWEHHGEPANIPGLEILARGPIYSGGKAQNVEYTSTIHPGPRGNLIFNAATIWWSLGLSTPPGFLMPSAHGGSPRGPDSRVQQITKNLFDRFRA